MFLKIIRKVTKLFIGTHIRRFLSVKMGDRALIYLLNPIEVLYKHKMFINPKDDALGLLVDVNLEFYPVFAREGDLSQCIF